MKKILTIMIMLLSFGAVAQDSTAVKNDISSFEEAVVPYIKKLVDGVEAGVDFAVRETPIVIQQYLVYEAIFYWTWILVSILMIIGGWKLRSNTTKKAIKLSESTTIDPELHKWEQAEVREKLSRELDEYNSIGLTLFIIPAVVASAIFFLNIFSAIKVTFFPKLYLVQKFIDLL